VPAAGGGWTTCTWCEGSRVDPVVFATWLEERSAAQPVSDWAVLAA
jgi:hypothetical protein